ncbi:hypothetical protein REPUB_Repub07fG0129100 [Reevesia pubescens]
MEKETSVPHRHKQKNVPERDSKTKRIHNERSNSPSTVTCISSPSAAYVSPHVSAQAPVMQTMELDINLHIHLHFCFYDNRYRTSDTPFLGPK